MVLHKRLDYGFNGYQVPPTPRAARSVRKRVPFKKKNEDNKMCAFDLLAIVAGNLLHEGESSSNASGNKDQCAAVDYPNNTVKTELQDEDKSLKEEVQDQGSPARNFFVSDILPGADRQNGCSKECPSSQSALDLGLASTVAPDCGESSNDVKLVHGPNTIETAAISGKVEVGSSEFRELEDSKLEAGINRIIKDEPNKFGNVLNERVGNMCRDEVLDMLDGKPPAHVSSNSSPKAALSGNHTPVRSILENKDVGVSRDDDENSSGCTHPRTTKKFLRAAPRIGDRRIRKILASKYWKATPRMKDMTHSNADGEVKPVYRSGKNYYKAQRSDRLYPFKKRKHFGYYSPSNSNGEISCELGLDSHQKANDGATGASSSISGQYTSFQPRDSHVKLRIKSFRVPELFIEIPDSATVGTLKRTVMDAVTAILGGGLRIGILLRGKKVRDDSKTLQQTGISHKHQLDALGFSLEPSATKTPPALCPGESPLLLTGDTPQPLSRYAPTSVMHQGDASSPENHVANMGDCIESDHDSAPSPINMSLDKGTVDSKALVVVPPINVDALAVIPSQRKSKRSEIAQRRIRRPFSVTEVEALVQAVEKLGTGRWRDVKLRAFDNAKHRTYVDLKDKWKTLVHTARISPQQRRGEPVPQELLDRVLNAHAYWSQQQAKQQLKLQQQHPETCQILL